LSVADINDVSFQTDIDLFKDWWLNVVQPMVIAGRVKWNTFSELYDLFTALEGYLESLTAQETVEVGKTTLIKALDYDQVTKVLTFAPIIEGGLYEFNYIVGWSAYEESEIMLAISWKLHTNDGLLPFYKLYIDGELQEMHIFNDFPAA
jgi:hypothetical protein